MRTRRRIRCHALALNSGYAINDYTGVITFTAAPPVTVNVRAKYKYCEDVIAGDGSTLVGYLNNVPAVAGSVVVCREDTTAETITVLTATTDYTVDPNNGKLTMVVAPASNQVVSAYLPVLQPVHNQRLHCRGFGRSGVLQDNCGAGTWRPGTPIGCPSPLVRRWISEEQAEAARTKAEIEYREGNFADAAATMQTAVDNLNGALAAEATFQNGHLGPVSRICSPVVGPWLMPTVRN